MTALRGVAIDGLEAERHLKHRLALVQALPRKSAPLPALAHVQAGLGKFRGPAGDIQAVVGKQRSAADDGSLVAELLSRNERRGGTTSGAHWRGLVELRWFAGAFRNVEVSGSGLSA